MHGFLLCVLVLHALVVYVVLHALLGIEADLCRVPVGDA